MNPLIPLLIVIGLGSCTLPLKAQEASTKKPAAPVVVPADINGFKTIIPPALASKPVKVAIYDGGGSSKAGVEAVKRAMSSIVGTEVTLVSTEQMGTVNLKAFDTVIFCGGVARTQAKSIGEAGMTNVREYVRGGGGYVGICAGAYLACSGFDWSLGILNARTVSSRWRRGTGYLEAEVTESGKTLLGEVTGVFKVRYNNGPVIKPDYRADIPAYTPVALFRTELAENNSPVGVMVNSPVAAMGSYGQGRVFISSPHPENTPGLEHLISRAILWTSGQDQVTTKTSSLP